MNASCGMDFCLIASPVNNNHTNEVLFWENFNHDTCLPPLRLTLSRPPVRLQNTDDWVVIICMLVECRRDFVCFHKGITVRSGTALFLKFVIQGSRGVDWDYGASIQHFCQCWWYDLWFSFLFFKHFFWRASVFLFVFLEWSHQFLKAPLCWSLRPIIPDLNFRLTFELNNEKLPETHKTAQKLVVMFLIVNRK